MFDSVKLFSSMVFSKAAFRERIDALVLEKFDGDNRRFAAACEKFNKKAAPSDSMIGRYRKPDGAVPRLDAFAVMADVLGVSMDYLAGVSDEKKPRPPESGIGAELLETDSEEDNPWMRRSRLVETVEFPASAVRPGYAFGRPGHYQLVIDFVVLGPDDREIIPFGEKSQDTDDES